MGEIIKTHYSYTYGVMNVLSYPGNKHKLFKKFKLLSSLKKFFISDNFISCQYFTVDYFLLHVWVGLEKEIILLT